MNQILLVGLGGALGSIARFKLSGLILRHTIEWRFPLPTFTINIIGCLVIGILAGLATKESFFSNDIRVFLFTGLVGGFTTFSAFGLETLLLLRREEFAIAALYVALSILIGIAVMFMSYSVVMVKS